MLVQDCCKRMRGSKDERRRAEGGRCRACTHPACVNTTIMLTASRTFRTITEFSLCFSEFAYFAGLTWCVLTDDSFYQWRRKFIISVTIFLIKYKNRLFIVEILLLVTEQGRCRMFFLSTRVFYSGCKLYPKISE